MIPAEIITALASHDANVVIEDGRLRLQFPEDHPPPAELINAVRAHKEQLWALLRDEVTGKLSSDLGGYKKSFATLRSRCPQLVEPARWRQAIHDADRFLAQWAAQAQAFGWTEHELCSPSPGAGPTSAKL
jgi:hypothetical protein